MRLRKSFKRKNGLLWHLHPPHQEQRQKSFPQGTKSPGRFSPPWWTTRGRIFGQKTEKRYSQNSSDIRLGSRRRTQNMAGWIEEAAPERAIGEQQLREDGCVSRADASGGG